MKPLKTLKDLMGVEANDKAYVSYDELKAEAIKWVKETRRINPEKRIDCHLFMEFHNITEEDLK